MSNAGLKQATPSFLERRIMSANISHLSNSSFDEMVGGSNKPVLVDFWAEWCHPCKQIAPVLEDIAVDRNESISIAKVDIDVEVDLASRYSVMSIPTLILFKEGQEVHRIVGARGKSALLQEIEEFL